MISGEKSFDARFACGTPRPDFAMLVLTKKFTDLLLDRPATRFACVVFQRPHRGTAGRV